MMLFCPSNVREVSIITVAYIDVPTNPIVELKAITCFHHIILGKESSNALHMKCCLFWFPFLGYARALFIYNMNFGKRSYRFLRWMYIDPTYVT